VQGERHQGKDNLINFFTIIVAHDISSHPGSIAPIMLFLFPHLPDLLAPPLRARAGISLSSQESCASRLFLGHMQHTCSQERELGTAIHAPFNELEPIHMAFERPIAPRKS